MKMSLISGCFPNSAVAFFGFFVIKKLKNSMKTAEFSQVKHILIECLQNDGTYVIQWNGGKVCYCDENVADTVA